MADGDVPGGNGTGGNATGGDGEEAVWLDLVARFGAPSPETADGEEQPWPDREDLAGPVRVSPNPGPTDGLPTDTLPGAQVRPLANSYHVATLDNDAPEIFDGTLAFIRDHMRAQTQ